MSTVVFVTECIRSLFYSYLLQEKRKWEKNEAFHSAQFSFLSFVYSLPMKEMSLLTLSGVPLVTMSACSVGSLSLGINVLCKCSFFSSDCRDFS